MASFELMQPPLSDTTRTGIGLVLAASTDTTTTTAEPSVEPTTLPLPTPVQSVAIPLLLTNKDVCVQALTGSGKTLAYSIPAIEMILRKIGGYKPLQVGAILVAPTRELASQVHKVVEVLCTAANITTPLLCIGGGNSKSMRSTKEDLEEFVRLQSDILVGTPGRLQDILTRFDTVDVRELDLLVLDEADTLLSMGFSVQVGGIIKALPSMRRTGLFSATMTKGVKDLSKAGLRNPVFVNVNVKATGDSAAATSTPSSLTNYYLICPLQEKLSRLAAFLVQHKDEKIIVFFLTCACVDFFGNALSELMATHLDYIEALHGKMNQKRRQNTLERYKAASTGALLCTDVAARGLDVTDINWVVQFDAPQDPASFVHRVGRAARAGRAGKSLILLHTKEDTYVEFLKLRKIPVTLLEGDEKCVEEEVEDVLPKVRQLVLKDRDYLEKGTSAFTSFIRAYKEHECSFIFRFASLDLGELATAFVLLRLPKMPELKSSHADMTTFTPAGPDVDIHGIRFKDKTREKARQARLAKELANGGKNAKQIKAEQKMAEKLAYQKRKKDEAVEKGRNPNKKRGKQAQIYDEWDELAKEERLNKKLKQGKIDKAEFKRLMRGDEKKAVKSDEIDSDDELSDMDE